MTWLRDFVSSQPLGMRLTIVSFTIFVLVFISAAGIARAQAINEGFEDITTLTAAGWVITNHSAPVGTLNWFQGSANSPFTAQAGGQFSYIGANYNSTGDTGTISDWLIAPNRTMKNGDVYTFYTRTVTGPVYPDRLQVRLSKNGASTNVGTTATDVGDFTTLLLDIDPTYVATTYPAN